MEVISITERQKNKLCEELAKLVFEFKKDRKVKCIYFAPYMDLGNIEGNVIEVTLVRDANEDDEFDKKVQDYNLSYQKEGVVEEFGLRIFVDTDDKRKYTVMDLNPSEVIRSNYLFNSVILFDQTGEFTKIKERITKIVKDNEGNISGLYYYFENLAEIVPPITDEVYRLMEIMQMDRDTEAVKEFTKSRLFEHFKNM